MEYVYWSLYHLVLGKVTSLKRKESLMPRESKYTNLYVILDDGQTYSMKQGCIIYDAEKKEVYRIRKGERIIIDMSWNKGIDEIDRMIDNDIHRGRMIDNDGAPIVYPEPIDEDDDGILGK
jgi:hypothetical protein